MTVSVGNDVLHVKGAHSFLLVASVREAFPLCIEASCEEYIQGVHAGDLVVVSAPEAGPVEPALMLLELVRTYHLPLLVLSRDHPGSKRIPYVVSVGPAIQTNCSIVRGRIRSSTWSVHRMNSPGITLSGNGDGIEISPLSPTLTLERIKSRVNR